MFNLRLKNIYLFSYVLITVIFLFRIPLLIIFGFVYGINGINFNFDSSSSSLANKTELEMKDLFLSVSEAVH